MTVQICKSKLISQTEKLVISIMNYFAEEIERSDKEQ